MQPLENEVHEENRMDQVPQSQSQELSDGKQPMMSNNQKSDILIHNSPHVSDEQVKVQDERLPEKHNEQQGQEILEEKQPLVENEGRLEIPKEQLPQGQGGQQQIHVNQLPERQNEQQERQMLEEKQPLIEKEKRSEILNEQIPQGQDDQQQVSVNQAPEKQNGPQVIEDKQPLVENEERSEILNGKIPQIQDEQQQILPEQIIERPNEQQEQEFAEENQPLVESEQVPEILNAELPQVQIPREQLLERPNEPQEQQNIINEQFKPRSDEQLRQNIPDEIRQISNAAQQQRAEVLGRRQLARQYEEQERQIPDEVRQMPDAQQQQAIREMKEMLSQQYAEMRQELLNRPQRSQSSDRSTLLSIFISTVIMVIVAFVLRSPTDYVARKEFEAFDQRFEAFKDHSNSGLVAVRESSQKSFSEHEARIAHFGKHYDDFLASMTKKNTTATYELPDHSIENLHEADRRISAEFAKLKTEMSIGLSKLEGEVNNLKKEKAQLQSFLKDFEGRFQKMEIQMKLVDTLYSPIGYFVMFCILIALIKPLLARR